MIRYLVKSSPIRNFWFTDRWRIDQSQSSQEPSLTDQTQGRQSRVLVWGGPSPSQGLVNEKVLCQSRVHIPGELSQPPVQSPGLVCREPSRAWVQRSGPRKAEPVQNENSSGLGRTKGCPKSRSDGNPVPMQSILSQVHIPGEKCQFSGLIWGKLSRSWVQTWFVRSQMSPNSE